MQFKITFFTTLLTALLIIAPPLLHAQTNAPDASPGADQNQTLLDNLERLTRQKEESETLKDLYADLNVKKRGYIAQVISIKDKTVRVKSLDGTEQFLTFDKSTTLIRKGQETTADQVEAADWLNIDDWIVVIGVEEDDQFLPRRILVSSVSLEPKPKIVRIGTVAAINSTKLSFIPRGGESVEEVKVSRNTIFQDRNGETIKAAQVKVDQSILVTGIGGNSGATAATIRVLSTVE